MRHQLVPYCLLIIEVSDSPPYIFTTPSKKRALELLFHDEEPLYLGTIYCIVIVVYYPYETSHSCDLALEDGVDCFDNCTPTSTTSLLHQPLQAFGGYHCTKCHYIVLGCYTASTEFDYINETWSYPVTSPPVPGHRFRLR